MTRLDDRASRSFLRDEEWRDSVEDRLLRREGRAICGRAGAAVGPSSGVRVFAERSDLALVWVRSKCRSALGRIGEVLN
jgi:hypothetical protein